MAPSCGDHPSHTWNVSGTLRGLKFTLTFVYTGADLGYTGTVVGVLGEDGSPRVGLGKAAAANQMFTWEAVTD